MSLLSAILGRRMHLIRPQTRATVRQRDLPVEMDDGTVLLADRWVMREQADRPQPTVLVRSPYGRAGIVGVLFGELLAERGLQVVIQSVRGTFGSGGEFSPFDERSDGLATLRWLRRQPWHRDRIGMIGPSYLGLVQWAVAADAGEDLAALAIQVSASQFHGQTYQGGGISLENVASWMTVLSVQEGRLGLLAVDRAVRRLRPVLAELPLGELDALATGAEVPWFREAFQNTDREGEYWRRRDYSARVPEVRAPVQMVGGWYDILLPWMLEDFVALQEAGRRPQLSIGPWTHTSPALAAAGHRDGIAWLRARLLGDERLVRRSAVRLRLTGEPTGERWRELPSWPPPGVGEHRLWLHAGAGLSEVPPSGAAPATGYRYDPSDPTPSVGGPVLLSREPVLDNRKLEARPDVLTFTTAPLPIVREAIGPVSVAVWASADAPSFDIFARVCDVDTDGASWNVCDGLVRVTPAQGEPTLVSVSLWPMGHRFAAGHRIRVQISSGAHPRYARNPGTGEDAATATRLRPARIAIHHDAEHQSVLVLPGAPSG